MVRLGARCAVPAVGDTVALAVRELRAANVRSTRTPAAGAENEVELTLELETPLGEDGALVVAAPPGFQLDPLCTTEDGALPCSTTESLAGTEVVVRPPRGGTLGGRLRWRMPTLNPETPSGALAWRFRSFASYADALVADVPTSAPGFPVATQLVIAEVRRLVSGFRAFPD